MRKMHILRINTPIKYGKIGVYIILLPFGINFVRVRSAFDCVFIRGLFVEFYSLSTLICWIKLVQN